MNKRLFIAVFYALSLLLALSFVTAEHAYAQEHISPRKGSVESVSDTQSNDEIRINHKIIASGDRQFYPYEFINKEGNADGFDVDLFRALMKNLNLDYDLTLGDWSQVHQLMKDKKIDVIIGVMFSPSRAKYISFSIPHNVITLSFTLKVNSNFDKIEDLRGKKIAVQKMDRGDDFLSENNFTNQVIRVNTIKEGFELLSLGKCDAVLFDHLSSLSMVKNLKISGTKIIDSGIAPQKYAIGVNPDEEDLLYLINQGLYQMKVSGEYDNIYNKWFSVTDTAGAKYRSTLAVVKWALVCLWVLLVLGAIFIMTLRAKVKSSTQELVVAKEKAERADKLKSVFLSNMSHEIRTPLNAIVGFANLLCEEGQDADDKKSYVEIIKGNSRQLLQLVSDILDTAKIESGTLVLNKSEFMIEDPCIESLMSVKVNFNNKDVQLLEDFRCDCLVNADLLRIEQVVTNFLTNAVKFTSKGSITVGTSACSDGETVEVFVIDTGIGISPDDARTVFDRFKQVGKIGKGTGLGLAISKHLIELSGGEIGVDSHLGVGSKFWFRLPIVGMSR